MSPGGQRLAAGSYDYAAAGGGAPRPKTLFPIPYSSSRKDAPPRFLFSPKFLHHPNLLVTISSPPLSLDSPRPPATTRPNTLVPPSNSREPAAETESSGPGAPPSEAPYTPAPSPPPQPPRPRVSISVGVPVVVERSVSLNSTPDSLTPAVVAVETGGSPKPGSRRRRLLSSSSSSGSAACTSSQKSSGATAAEPKEPPAPLPLSPAASALTASSTGRKLPSGYFPRTKTLPRDTSPAVSVTVAADEGMAADRQTAALVRQLSRHVSKDPPAASPAASPFPVFGAPKAVMDNMLKHPKLLSPQGFLNTNRAPGCGKKAAAAKQKTRGSEAPLQKRASAKLDSFKNSDLLKRLTQIVQRNPSICAPETPQQFLQSIELHGQKFTERGFAASLHSYSGKKEPSTINMSKDLLEITIKRNGDSEVYDTNSVTATYDWSDLLRTPRMHGFLLHTNLRDICERDKSTLLVIEVTGEDDTLRRFWTSFEAAEEGLCAKRLIRVAAALGTEGYQ